MIRNIKAVAGLAVALMLVMSVFAGGAAAWTSNSDVDDSTYGVSFTDDTTDEQIKLAISDTAASSADDVELRVTGADFAPDGTMTELQNVDVLTISGAQTDSTNGEYYFTVNESSLSEAPRGAGNAHAHFKLVDTTDGTVLDEQSITISDEDDGAADMDAHVYANDVNASAADYDPAAGGLVADSNTIENESMGGFLGIGAEKTDVVGINGWTKIDGDNSSIEIHTGEERGAILADSAGNDSEAGDVVDVNAHVGTEEIVVYYDEAPESASGHTHAVFDSETENIVINLGEEHADAQTVTFDVQSHDDPSFSALSDAVGFGQAVVESLDLPF